MFLTACGGLDTGLYTDLDWWSGTDNGLYDGDWNTGRLANTGAYLISNYTMLDGGGICYMDS